MRLTVELDSATIEFAEQTSSGPYPWLVKVGSLRIAARAGQNAGFGSGESQSLEVTVDNARRQAAAVLGVPLRRAATVFADDDSVFFEGTIAQIEFGQVMRMTVEA